VAAKLTDAAGAIRNGQAPIARAALVEAAASLTAETRAELLDAPMGGQGPAAGRLDGLLADALRRTQR
jgi:hypothetical protein